MLIDMVSENITTSLQRQKTPDDRFVFPPSHILRYFLVFFDSYVTNPSDGM